MAPTGNGILDAFTKLVSVGVQTAGQVYGAYSTIQERQIALEIARQNATQPPQQAMPANMVNTPSDFYSNPQRVQQAFFFAAVAAVTLIGGAAIVKKVF